MKKKFGVTLATAMMVVGAMGIANAIEISTTVVGDKDFVEGFGNVTSGNGFVEAWLATELGGTASDWNILYKNDDSTGLDDTDFYLVTEHKSEDDKWYAFDLAYNTEYFVIKVGTGGTGNTYDHYLFKNLASMDYAVFTLGQLGFNPIANNVSIGRISHVTEIGDPVPEPTTMLLFGAGLAGLAAVGRRRKNA